MATSFPGSLDAFSNPTSSSSTTTVDHAAQHANANDAIEALEARVGVTSSAVSSSLTYRIATLEATGVDSSAWTSYTTTWGASSAPSLGNGTMVARYKRIGKTFIGHIYLAWGSTTTGGSGKWTFQLPSGITSGASQLSSSVGGYIYDASADYTYAVAAIIGASTATIEMYAGQTVTATTPMTWTTNDRMSLDFVIETT